MILQKEFENTSLFSQNLRGNKFVTIKNPRGDRSKSLQDKHLRSPCISVRYVSLAEKDCQPLPAILSALGGLPHLLRHRDRLAEFLPGLGRRDDCHVGIFDRIGVGSFDLDCQVGSPLRQIGSLRIRILVQERFDALDRIVRRAHDREGKILLGLDLLDPETVLLDPGREALRVVAVAAHRDGPGFLDRIQAAVKRLEFRTLLRRLSGLLGLQTCGLRAKGLQTFRDAQLARTCHSVGSFL